MGKKNKENAQSESCKLSFIWGTVRTAAWETASQMSEKLLALGNCSKEAKWMGEVSIYVNLNEGGYMQSNMYISRRFLPVS